MKGFIFGILFAAILDYNNIVDASEFIVYVQLLVQTTSDWILGL